ncbi:MAG TPA: hypothetical protein VFH88_12995 [Candidatus Krumholzibacteria bacterium]|nr:hypothetical protein [Candidatus Krumholzibacteria bacterium]
MDTSNITLTSEERALLVEVLESALKDTLIEEHRTRVPTYREAVVRHGEVLTGLLDKLKAVVS